MNFSKKSGKKKATAAAVLCFVAAIAIAGTYTFNDYKKSQSEKELAKAEEINSTEEKYTVISEMDEIGEIDEAVDGKIVENETDDLEVDTENSKETVENVSSANAVTVNFSDNSLMLWPVSGTVLLDYSMDKTVYFKTLDQYKYNPAMIIAAAENDKVMAGASGIIKSIDNFAETGTTVNVDFGNGYEAVYGQLLNVQVQTGDYVEATTTLEYVAQPTKYYIE